MINKFEVQVDPKACKHYIDAFDVIFVDDHHDLRFCRYCKQMDASISGKYHMVVKDNDQIFDYITRDAALCFYDRDRHRWCSKIDDHRLKCWEVVGPEDNIFINVLVGIAIDEISKIKTDYLSVDDLTHRIKCRFGIWFDEYTKKRSWDSLANRAEKFFFDESVRIPQTRNNGERFKIRNGKPNPTTYQLPQPKFVQVNGIFTTVVWKDGTHTVVKLHNGDQFDIQTAVLYATIKRMCANNGCEMDRYLSRFSDRVIFKKETDYDRNEETYAKKDN